MQLLRVARSSYAALTPKKLVEKRYEKFRKMGNFFARRIRHAKSKEWPVIAGVIFIAGFHRRHDLVHVGNASSAAKSAWLLTAGRFAAMARPLPSTRLSASRTDACPIWPRRITSTMPEPRTVSLTWKQ